MNAAAVVWLIACGSAAALCLAVVGTWAAQRPAVRRQALPAALCVAATIALALLFFDRSQVPTGWITVLMEGRSVRNVQQLYGHGSHFGSGFYFLEDWLTGHDVTTLRAVVHANLVTAAVNVVLFFFIAAYVLGSRPVAAIFALGYAANLNTLHAAVSETPAMLWATHFFLGCSAAAAIDDEGAGFRLRLAAVVWLSLLVWLVGQLRSELLVAGLPALGAAAVRLWLGQAAMQRAAAASVEFLHSIVSARLPIFLIAAGALAALEFLPWPGNIWGWAAAGLRPLNLSFLAMYWTLGALVAFAFVALSVLGVIHGLRRWPAFLLLPITFVVLLKVYATASHGVLFERWRYLAFLMPVVFFFALFGFRELSHWAQRWSWPPWWKQPVLLLLAMTFTVWQAAGPKEIFRRRQQLPGVATPAALLSWNQQTEVRYMLDLTERHPTCAFLVRSAQTAWVADRRVGYLWSAFGTPVRSYRELPDLGESPEQVADQLAPAADCLFYYRSLDCDLIDADGCVAATTGRTPIEERVFGNLPYSDITEYGAHRAEIRLGVFQVR
jgi:hypothetical protein